MRAYNMWIADIPDFPNRTFTIDAQVQLDNRIIDELLLISYRVANHNRRSNSAAEKLISTAEC